MRRSGIKPNAYTITSCISALARGGEWEKAAQVRSTGTPNLICVLCLCVPLANQRQSSRTRRRPSVRPSVPSHGVGFFNSFERGVLKMFRLNGREFFPVLRSARGNKKLPLPLSVCLSVCLSTHGHR